MLNVATTLPSHSERLPVFAEKTRNGSPQIFYGGVLPTIVIQAWLSAAEGVLRSSTRSKSASANPESAYVSGRMWQSETWNDGHVEAFYWQSNLLRG